MKIVLSILLIIISNLCPAQPYKSIVYNSVGQNVAIYQLSKIGDTSYYLQGSICPNGNQCTSIRSVDKNNNVLFDIFFDTLDIADIYALCSDGKYLYVNTTINYSQYPFTCVMLKLDRNGNVLKKIEYKYDSSEYNIARSINIAGDSVVVCYAIDTKTEDSTYYLFFDKELNLGKTFRYSQKPINSKNETSYHLYPTLDGNYITNRLIIYKGGAYSKQLIKFNQGGKVIWDKEIAKVDIPFPSLMDGLLIMPDSSLVFNHHKHIDTTDFLIAENPVTIIKISSDGNKLLWEHTFISYGHQINYFLQKAKNNDIIGGGQYLVIIKEDKNPWEQYDLGWIYRLSNEGKLLWERKIVDVAYNPSSSYLYSGLELDNGDLVFGGGVDTSYNPNNLKPIQNSWVLRLDKDGCINSGCLDTIFITSTFPVDPIPINNILVYPNPAIDHITIQIPTAKEPESIKIVDVQGKIQMKLDFNVHLKIESLPAGIYNIIFYWADGKVATAGFVKI